MIETQNKPHSPLPPANVASPPIVDMQGVGKHYHKRWAVTDINLTLYPGEVVGFIGPNGAGKTTLMKLMAGLTRASVGTIVVLGEQLNHQRAITPEGIGLVMEHIGFIPYLSGRKNLEALARLRNVATPESIAATLDTVGLDPTDKRPVRAYSLGMRQRLGLAQALMEQPRLLLLDEPSNGLDPAGVVDLRRLIRTLANRGTTIFLASHLLTEIERVCDRVLLVQAGKIVEEIQTGIEGPARVQIIVSAEDDVMLLEAWAKRSGITIEHKAESMGRPTVEIPAVISNPQIARELVALGINIEAISSVRRSLEDAFMTVVGPHSDDN